MAADSKDVQDAVVAHAELTAAVGTGTEPEKRAKFEARLAKVLPKK